MYKKLRRLRELKEKINYELGTNITYYHLKHLYEEKIIRGLRIGKTIYLYYDETIDAIKKGY